MHIWSHEEEVYVLTLVWEELYDLLCKTLMDILCLDSELAHISEYEYEPMRRDK